MQFAKFLDNFQYLRYDRVISVPMIAEVLY